MAYIPLTVYRELADIPPDLYAWLDVRNQLFEVTRESDQTIHYFTDDEQPRDSDITDEIIERTVGFALFAETDDGPELVGTYRNLMDAENARQGAKVTIAAPEIEVESAPGWDSLSGPQEDGE